MFFETDIIDNNKKFLFEIQIRTITQDAWASISHYLDYKNEISIADELKKDFYALSGLFYIADTQFNKIQESVLLQKFYNRE